MLEKKGEHEVEGHFEFTKDEGEEVRSDSSGGDCCRGSAYLKEL